MWAQSNQPLVCKCAKLLQEQDKGDVTITCVPSGDVTKDLGEWRILNASHQYVRFSMTSDQCIWMIFSNTYSSMTPEWYVLLRNSVRNRRYPTTSWLFWSIIPKAIYSVTSKMQFGTIIHISITHVFIFLSLSHVHHIISMGRWFSASQPALGMYCFPCDIRQRFIFV